MIRAFKKSFHTLEIFLFFKRKKSAFAEFVLEVIFPQVQFTKYVVPVSSRYMIKNISVLVDEQTPRISREKRGDHSASLTKGTRKRGHVFHCSGLN